MMNVLGSVMGDGISDQQRINFTEAALIRYFQPEYNTLFKDPFPSPVHSSYASCYDVDLNMIAVEVGSEDLGCKFWSKHVEPKWTHIAAFPLHSREQRKHMFDLFPGAIECDILR